MGTEMADAIDRQEEKLADTHAGSADQEQGVGEQIVLCGELLLQTMIIVGRKGSGKSFIQTRQIVAEEKSFGDLGISSSQVDE
jgi:hypothetical protein